MKLKPHLFALAVGALATPAAVFAADHLDSPAAVSEPAADITDLYAWTNDNASKVNLVLNVTPFAGTNAAFSDAVQYVIHVNSSGGFGQPQTQTLIMCQFDAAGVIECWAGDDEYLKGDTSTETGLVSESGKLRVFAGLRNDPFFFELTGFQEAVKIVVGAADGLTFDAAGCPELDEQTATTLVNQLQSGAGGAAASDTFAGANVLSLVVQVDKSLVTAGGPVLGVWASTHTR